MMYFGEYGEGDFDLRNSMIFCMNNVVTYFCLYVMKKNVSLQSILTEEIIKIEI